MYKKAAMGGTFDNFHVGHEALIDAAINVASKVVIGVTSDEFAKRFRVHDVEPYKKRINAVKDYCKGRNVEIAKIEDQYGPATTDRSIDCIVVSEETFGVAQQINCIRFKKGLKRLAMVVVPLVLANNKRPISSADVRSRVMDREGHLR